MDVTVVSRPGLGEKVAEKKPESSNRWDKRAGLSRPGLEREWARFSAEIGRILGQMGQESGLSRPGLEHESAWSTA